MRRLVISLYVITALLLGVATPAFAGSGGSVNSPGNGGYASVNLPGGGGGSAGGGGGGSSSGGNGGGSGGGGSGGGGGGGGSSCYYTSVAAPAYGPGVQIRTLMCGGVAGPGVLFTPLPGGPAAAAGPPPPPPPPPGVVVAQQALAGFVLATPTIGMAPGPDRAVVRFPEWFWLTEGWRDQSATASLQGVSATVVARPLRALWEPGDGSSLVCEDAGQVYGGPQDAGRPSSCSHEYTTSSSLQSDQRYRVSTRVSYHMTWSSSDRTSGDLGTITSPAGSTSIQVGEIQALNIPTPPGVGG